MTRPRTRWRTGDQHAAAYPVRDSQGRPAWQGIIVVEPDEVLWRCPHAHLVDRRPGHRDRSHADAVACAAETGRWAHP